jgi:Ca2+-dependent lipid-binding protein
MDYGGTSDPYCILEVGDEIIETTVKQKTLNPRWDESFSFPIATGKEVSYFRALIT